MNARTPIPPGAKPQPRTGPRAHRADQEFLPAALEILETPASPIGVWMLWVICLLAAGVLAWSYFGQLDVIAVAQGKIQPAGRVKVIQPVEAGRIAALFVENGQRVGEGQELVALDSGEADADANGFAANLDAFRAEAARRNAALAMVKARTLTPLRAIAWSDKDAIPEAIKARETHVLEGDIGQLASTIAGLRAQRRQKQLEAERNAATVTALEALVATLKERVDMRAALEIRRAGTKSDLIDALEGLQDKQTTLVTTIGQRAESAAAVEVLEQSIEESYRKFAAENLQKLAEAERQIDDIEQKLAKARVRQHRMVIKSPIGGTVSALSVTTIGQVVAAGDELMRVVPDRIGIEIEAYLQNRDIGFVRPGQDAVVKIESLPFTRYGTIAATVTRVASDAIPEPDADQTEGNPIRSVRDKAFTGAQRTQNLVFPLTLQPAATAVVADDGAVPLSPGMAVTVEIKTGSRRILEYVFSPLVEMAAQSMKER